MAAKVTLVCPTCATSFDVLPSVARSGRRYCSLGCRPQAGANLASLEGQRFGRLTVVARAGTIDNNAAWLCRCDCGNETVVNRPCLRIGATKSCGCLYIESRTRPRDHYTCRLPPGEASKRNLLKSYHYAAREKNLAWELSPEAFHTLSQQPCHYCGTPPVRVRKVSRNGEFYWNGIDRVDNTIGYTPGNTVTCCHTCNHAKCAMDYDEFLAWVRRLALHLGFNPPKGQFSLFPPERALTQSPSPDPHRRNQPFTYQGRTQTVTEWAREVGIASTTLRQRLEHGWSVSRALTQPLQLQRPHKPREPR